MPAEERAQPSTGVEQACEEARIVRLVLEGLEPCLAERIVVGDMRPTEALVDAERCQELRKRVALHGGAAVGVHDKARLDAMASGSLGEELGRQVLALLRRDHPADNVPAEQIDDHVNVQEDALLERGQLGDVPGPYLVGRCRGERGFDVRVWKTLIPALFRARDRKCGWTR